MMISDCCTCPALVVTINCLPLATEWVHSEIYCGCTYCSYHWQSWWASSQLPDVVVGHHLLQLSRSREASPAIAKL
jgi:hypothetical protein